MSYKKYKSKINYEKIEKKIRKLVYAFNKLDFVATIHCCEGHDEQLRNPFITMYIDDYDRWFELMKEIIMLEPEQHDWTTLEIGRIYCREKIFVHDEQGKYLGYAEGGNNIEEFWKIEWSNEESLAESINVIIEIIESKINGNKE